MSRAMNLSPRVILHPGRAPPRDLAVEVQSMPTTTSKKQENAAETAPKRTAAAKQNQTGAAQKRADRITKAKTTTDHDEIRQWAEARKAKPARVEGTGRKGSETGILRLDFPGYSGQGRLTPISWEEFFEQFERNQLALLYQEKTAGGKTSNFNKLVSRGE